MTDTLIPDDKSKWTVFEPIEEDIYIQGRILLEAVNSGDDFESYKSAREHYKACTNEEELEVLGAQPLLKKLQEFGGWPVVEGDKWSGQENFSVWEWTYKMNVEGFEVDHLISFSLVPDDKNTTWRVIKLDQAELGMSREYLIKGFEDKDVQHYYQYMVDSAVLFGADLDNAKKEMKESLIFEIDLAYTNAAREHRRNASVLYNPTTAGEAKIHEGLPTSWTEYIQNMLQIADTITVHDNEKIVIASPDYLEKLGKLLTNTDKRTLANYLAWRATKPFMTYLNEDARQIRQKYMKAIKGVQVIIYIKVFGF